MPSTHYLRVAVDATGAKTGAAVFEQSEKRVVTSAKRIDTQIGQTDRKIDTLGASSTSTAHRLQSLGRGLSGLAGPLGVTFGAFAAFSAVKSTITTLAQFEESMLTLGAVTGATGDTMQRLEETALRAGATTRFTATQSGEALLFLARAGFTAEESMAALKSTQNLASAGAISVGEAADYASNLVKQFGLEAAATERAVDSMVNVSNNANTNVRQLAEAMKYAGPIARSAGLDIETSAAAIGVLGDAGVQASLAGTNLRGVILALAKPTSEARSAFDKLGLSWKDVDPVRNGLVDAFKALSDAQLDLTASGAIFGRRNAGAALILSDSVKAMEELIAKQREGSGEAQKMADTVESGLSGAGRRVLSAFEAMQLSADKTMPAITGLMDNLAGSMRWVAENGETIASVFEFTKWLPGGSGPADAASSFVSSMFGEPEQIRKTREELEKIRTEAQAMSGRANFGLTDDDNATQPNINRVIDELVVLKDAYTDIVGLQNKMNLQGDEGATSQYQKIVAGLQTANRVPEIKASTSTAAALEMIANRIEDVEFAWDMLEGKMESLVDKRMAAADAEALDETRDALKKYTDKIEKEIELLAMSEDERERHIAGLRLENDLRGKSDSLIEKAKIHLDDSIKALQGERKAQDDSAAALKAKSKAEKDAISTQQRLEAQRDRVLNGLQQEISLIGLNNRERQIQLALMDAGVSRYSEEGKQIEALTGKLTDLQDSERLARSFGDAWGNAFAQIAENAHNGRDAIRILLEEMRRAAISNASQGVSKLVGDFLASFLGGGGNSGGVQAGGPGNHQSSTGTPGVYSALGNVIGPNGIVERFALGGRFGRHLTGPTEFMMGNGRRGVAGEAGEEVVMQVARDSKGRMGVRAVGGGDGGGGDTYITNVNVRTKNFDGFRQNKRSIERHMQMRRR